MIDFSAYVVDLPILQYSRREPALLTGTEQNRYLNLTRLRLRPMLHFDDDTQLGIEYELALSASSDIALLTPAPETIPRQLVDLFWQPVHEEHWQLRHFVDRLYLKHNFSFGQLIVGRQRISVGSGRIWNPTDVFNPISPVVFTKVEKDGADALTLKTYLDDFTDLLLIYNPEHEARRNNVAVRFRGKIEEFDLALMTGYVDRRFLLGADFAGNLFDAGVRGEALYSVDDDANGDSRLSFILGADYQFSADFYALIEYHFNGAGTRQAEGYDFDALLRGTILNLGRHYLHVQSAWQAHPLIGIGLSLNGNLNDGSGFLALSGNYSLSDEASISLAGQFTHGNRKGLLIDEFWLYPSSVYLQAEVYF